MRKRIIIILAAVVVVVAAATGYVIKKNQKSYDFNSVEQVVKDTNNNKEKILSKKYTNLDLSNVKDVMMDADIDNVYTFTATRFPKYDDSKYDKFIDHAVELGKDIWNVDITPDEKAQELMGTLYWTTGNYTVGCSEKSIFLYDNTFPIIETYIHEKEIIRQVYRISEGDSTEGVTLSQDGYSLDDAIEYANSIVDKYLMTYVWAGQIRIRTALKYTMPDGSEQYVLRYENVLDDIAIDEAGDYAHLENGGMLPSWLEIRINGKEHINKLYCNSFTMQEKTAVDEVLPLSEALQKASDKLAPYGVYEINSIEIKYCCLYGPQKEETTYVELLAYRPMWVMDVYVEKVINTMEVDPRMSIYVDATDGEVYILDATNMDAQYFTLDTQG